MVKVTKNRKEVLSKVDLQKNYDIGDAVDTLKETTKAKFEESIDMALILGVDARKSDQMVRGSVVMPHGTGKTQRIAVLTKGDNIEVAKNAEADLVGDEDLREQISKGVIEFDVLIATPDVMPSLAKLGQILGPRGLMPNPKSGTVTTDVAKTVDNLKKGQVFFRGDKNGIIHCSIARINFSNEAIKENLETLISEIKRLKPSTSKGMYLKRLILSTTMGIGLRIDMSSLTI